MLVKVKPLFMPRAALWETFFDEILCELQVSAVKSLGQRFGQLPPICNYSVKLGKLYFFSQART
jgi:hypothetical protein